MDILIHSCLDNIALSGLAGTLLVDLWKNISLDLGKELSQPIKQWLWKEIQARGRYQIDDPRLIRFYFSPLQANLSAPPSSEGLGLRDASRRPATHIELQLPLSELEKEYGGLYLRVVASPVARAKALGLKDPDTNIFPASYSILEAIGSSKKSGLIQADISGLMGTDNKTIFHHLKKLALLKLITRRQVLVRRAKPLQSNHVLLTRFSSEEPSSSNDKDYDAEENNIPEVADEDEEDDQEDAQQRSLTVYSDMAMRVCRILSNASGMVLREVDINRAATSMSNTTSKRAIWSVIKKKLIELGFIKSFIGCLPNPNGAKEIHVKCIELVKMPSSAKDIETTFKTNTSTSLTHSRPIIAEYPLDYQIWCMIEASGSNGVPQATIRFYGVSSRIISKKVEILSKMRKLVTALAFSSGKIRSFLLKSTSNLRELRPEEVGVSSIAPSFGLGKKKTKESKTATTTTALTNIKSETETESNILLPQPISRTQKSNNEPKSIDQNSTKSLAPNYVPINFETNQAIETNPSIETKPSNQTNLDISQSEQAQSQDVSQIDQKPLTSPKWGISKPKQKIVTTTFTRRRNFLMDQLATRGVLVMGGLRKLLHDHETESVRAVSSLEQPHADTKTIRKVANDIVESKEAYYRSTSMDVGGTRKKIDFLIRADLSEQEWKKIAMSMTDTELLSKTAVSFVPNNSNIETMKISQVDSVDTLGNLSKSESTQNSLSSPLRAKRTASEARLHSKNKGDDVLDEENDENKQEIEKNKYPKNVTQSSVQAPQNNDIISLDINQDDHDDFETSNQTQEENGSEFSPYFYALQLGLERARIIRASILHMWICYELFGEKVTGPLLRLIPNQLKSPKFVFPSASNSKNTSSHDTKASSSMIIDNQNDSSQIEHFVSENDQQQSQHDSSHPNTQTPQKMQSAYFFSALVGASSSRRILQSQLDSETFSKPESNQTESEGSYYGREDKDDNPKRSKPISGLVDWQVCRERWFDGPDFNIDSLLARMPLYIFCKCIGLMRRDTSINENDIFKYSTTPIGELPESFRLIILSRSHYSNRLSKLMKVLKSMNLITPKVSLLNEQDEDERPMQEPPVIPLHILNPIAIIWHKQFSYSAFVSAKNQEKILSYAYKFDGNQNTFGGLMDYWMMLEDVCLDFVRETMLSGVDCETQNEAPPEKSFPTKPGLPLVCISYMNWTGSNQTKATRALKASWKKVSAEMSRVQGCTETMLKLASELHLKPTSVLKWYENYQKQAKKRPANEIDEQEQNPRKKVKTKATESQTQAGSIDIPLGKKHTIAYARRNAMKMNEDEEQEIENEENNPIENEPSFDSTGSRVTSTALNSIVKAYILQKAQAGLHLDDLSTLFEGIDKKALSQAANKPFEMIEKYIRQLVSTKAGLFNLASSISKKIRDLEEMELNGEIEANQPSQSPTFEIFLPKSINYIRENYDVSYDVSAALPGSNLMQQNSTIFETAFESTLQSSDHIEPSISHKKQVSTSSSHQIDQEQHAKAEKSENDRFDSAAHPSRLPSSRWMKHPDYHPILSDNMKSLLLRDPSSQNEFLVKHLISTHFTAMQLEECYQDLKKRHIITSFKNFARGRSHLTLQFLSSMTKDSDFFTLISDDSKEYQNILDSENAGQEQLQGDKQVDKQTENYAKHWSLQFDPVSTGGVIAAIIDGIQNKTLTIETHVESIAKAGRKSRKPIANIPIPVHHPLTILPSSSSASSPSSNDQEEVKISIQWWREHKIFERYDSEFDSIGEAPIQLPIQLSSNTIVPQESSFNVEDNDMVVDFVDQQNSSNEWKTFVQLMLSFGESKSTIDLCKHIYDIVEASGISAIEMYELEKALYDNHFVNEVSNRSGEFPILETTEIQKIMYCLEKMVCFGLLLRVLANLGEAWVTLPNSGAWVIPKSEDTDQNQHENAEMVIFYPWILPDGSMDHILLRHLKATLASKIASNPGITEEDILDQYECFRPAIARDLLRLLELDDVVSVKYVKFTPINCLLSYTDPNNTTSSDINPATESDYQQYLRRRYAKMRYSQQEEDKSVVCKGYWPNQSVYTRI